MTLEPEPLTPDFGALLDHPDLNTASDADIDNILSLRARFGVVFFHQQNLDPASLLALAARFGTPVPYPFVTGLADFPEVIEVVKTPSDAVNFGGVWHSDTAYLQTPASGALLYGEQVPAAGGDTLFTDMVAVWRSLSPGLQDLLRTLSAVNSSDKPAISQTRPGQQARGLEAVHPVVRQHPQTGDELLFVDRAHTTRFEDMTGEESQPLLDYLFDVIEQPEFSCRFRWQPGSLAFWDNCRCQHYPLNDYPRETRKMLRVSLG